VRHLLSGLLLLALAAGCGDDETIPLSEYVERANAICRENNTKGRAEVDRLRKELEAGGELGDDDIVELNRKTLEVLRPGMERLEALPAPDEQREAAEDYERLTHEANDAFAEVVDAADDGDSERMAEAIDRNKQRARESHEVATDLGLDDCVGR
jgi:hypothetical protein